MYVYIINALENFSRALVLENYHISNIIFIRTFQENKLHLNLLFIYYYYYLFIIYIIIYLFLD